MKVSRLLPLSLRKSHTLAQSLSCVWPFVTPWTEACQASLFFTISWSLLKLMSTSSRWCHLTISSSSVLFTSCPQSFPALGSFPMSQLFASGGQSIGTSASASVFPMNSQGWFSLGGLDWSLWFSRYSQESSAVPWFKRINSSVLSHTYGPTLTSVHYYWRNHSFDYMDLCWQSNVSGIFLQIQLSCSILKLLLEMLSS